MRNGEETREEREDEKSGGEEERKDARYRQVDKKARKKID